MSTYEVEIKIPLKEREVAEVRSKLNALGAKLIEKVHEVDYYVDLRDLIDELHIPKDIVLRVRHKKGASRESCEVTFKGPRESDEVKLRKEITLLIDDCSKALEIIKHLNLKTLTVVKEREVYWLGDLKIYVDNVKGLGWFIEVEGMDMNVGMFKHLLSKLLRKLGLSGREYIIRSYLELLIEHYEKTGKYHSINN